MIRFVDFDGVLAHFDHWRGPEHFGAPVPEMIKKVLCWLLQGDKVVIYTARLTPGDEIAQTKDVDKTRKAIEAYCLKYIGQVLPITNVKTYADFYYDDHACQIIPNTGLTLAEKIGGIIANKGDPYKALEDISKLLKEANNGLA